MPKPSLNDRILVTGSAGMVGSNLHTHLNNLGFKNTIGLTRRDCDLENQAQVASTFNDIRPDYIYHIAAKVGGIKANIDQPVEFLESNLLSQIHVLKTAQKIGVKKILLLGSSCIYPRECPQPMKEEFLLTGPLEPTNEGYALAKISGIRLAQYYSKQYGLPVVLPMPCNIYGPGDSFDLNHCHVLSALVKRFIDAINQKSSSITLWGTGTAKREFIHVLDVASALTHLMDNVEDERIYNVGTGKDISIYDLAQLISKKTGFSGEITWDKSKPDGMPRKCVDVTRLSEMGFTAKISLNEGIDSVIKAYKNLLNERY